ncbi:MAG: MFS transporter [Roseivirga sp.]|nr:MFS transporter [Roseivirga sp.]
MSSSTPKRILPTIIFSQFAGTSLWFAGNAIIGELQADWALPTGAIASVTSAVMFGFIIGTFVFALFSIADRFKPSGVFFICAILGALANAAIILLPASYLLLLVCRFLTGLFLAGIYPVGMKIASDWFAGKLGKALGYLVGALVVGTAFPHLLNYYGSTLSWKFVLTGTSTLAVLGGISMLLLVGEGPHRKKGASFKPARIIEVFQKKDFRSAAFGYFGHMWELYTFWAFLPLIITFYNQSQGAALNPSLWSFIIIAGGALSCVLGGIYSVRLGSAKVAFGFLSTSGLMCLLSPLFFMLPPPFFLSLLVIWGLAVIGDSAQFSSLNAQTAPKELVGTALTIVVSIGFLLTIPSIQLLGWLADNIDTRGLLLTLAIGPVFGLLNTKNLLNR